KRSTRWRAERLIRHALAEVHATRGQGVDVRCLHGRILVVYAHEIGAKLVGADHQHIGPARGSRSSVHSTGGYRSIGPNRSHSARGQSVTQKVSASRRGILGPMVGHAEAP